MFQGPLFFKSYFTLTFVLSSFVIISQTEISVRISTPPVNETPSGEISLNTREVDSVHPNDTSYPIPHISSELENSTADVSFFKPRIQTNPLMTKPPVLQIFVQPEVLIPATRAPPLFMRQFLRIPPFSVHDNTTYSQMADMSEHVCGQKGLCDRISPWNCEILSVSCQPCRCDELCFHYGDCCPDRFLSKQPNISSEPDSCISSMLKPTPTVKEKRYLMLDTCPEDNQLAVDCHTNKTADVDLVPVYSRMTKRHYKNQYCARCNNISDFTNWDIEPVCKGFIDYNKVTSPETYFKEALSNPSCGIHGTPPPGAPTRECFVDHQTMVSYCPTDYPHETHVRACRLYRQPITFRLRTYRNIYCAYCNGVSLNRMDTKCSTEPFTWPSTAPLSVLFNFRSTESLSSEIADAPITEEVVCQPTEIYDSVKELCRSLVCPTGKFPFNHTCENFFQSTEGVGYKLRYYLYPENRDNVSVFVIDAETLYRDFMAHSKYLSTLTDASYRKTIFESVYMEPVTRDPNDGFLLFNMTVHIYIVVRAKMPRETLEVALVKFLNDGWFYYNKDSVTPQKFVSKLIMDDTDIVKNFTVSNYLELDSSGIINRRIEQHSEKYSIDIIPDIYRKDPSSYIPVTNLMLCDGVLLNRGEYAQDDNMSIVVLSTGHRLEEGQYIPQNNSDKIQVCAEFAGIPLADAIVNTNDQPAFDLTETIITVVCTSFSLAGLAITFIVYAITPSLRTLPGKNNMALFLNLFCAQLMFQAGIVANVDVTACRLLGVIIHYLWLSTFCWKLVCAYHMFRVFTRPLKRVDDMKTYGKYCIFAQSAPLLLIMLYTSIQYASSPVGEVGYADQLIAGDRRLCFLSTTLDWALAFASPVGLIILINAYFFIRIVYTLQHRPDLNQHNVKSDVSQTVIYLKMSLLLGFTWAFGFLAMVVDTQLLWYLFTILNASIGVFVFFSFVHVRSCFQATKKKYDSTSHAQSPAITRLKYLDKHLTQTSSLSSEEGEPRLPHM